MWGFLLSVEWRLSLITHFGVRLHKRIELRRWICSGLLLFHSPMDSDFHQTVVHLTLAMDLLR
jgi:hypothetical protein